MIKYILFLSCLILVAPLSARGTANTKKEKVEAGNTFKILQESYIKVSSAIVENFKKYAFFLLFSLAAIDLAWSGFKLAFDSANLSAFIKFFVEKFFFLTLFVYLINNLPALSQDFLDSASMIGQDIAKIALGENLNVNDGNGGTIYARPIPNSMLVFALQFWDYLMDAKLTLAMQSANALTFGLLYILLILPICLFIGFLGILQILIFVEVNFLLPVYIFILGFGGLKATQATGLKIIFVVLGAAFKLLVLNMIIATGISFFFTLVPPGTAIGFKILIALLLGTMAIVALSLTLPGKISALIGGMDSGIGRSFMSVGSTALQMGGVAALGAIAAKRFAGASVAGAITSAQRTGLFKGAGSGSELLLATPKATSGSSGSNNSSSTSATSPAPQTASNDASSMSKSSTPQTGNNDASSTSKSPTLQTAGNNDASSTVQSDKTDNKDSTESSSSPTKQKLGEKAKKALVFGGKLAATAALTPFVTGGAIEHAGLKNASRHLLGGHTSTGYLAKQGVSAMGRSASHISQALKNHQAKKRENAQLNEGDEPV